MQKCGQFVLWHNNEYFGWIGSKIGAKSPVRDRLNCTCMFTVFSPEAVICVGDFFRTNCYVDV